MQGWSIDVSALALVALLLPLLHLLVRRLRKLHVVSPVITAAAEFEPSESAPSKTPLKPTRAAQELPAVPPCTSEATPRPRARTVALPPAPSTSSIREKARTSPPKPRRKGKRRSVQR